jgi:hypothetical protein
MVRFFIVELIYSGLNFRFDMRVTSITSYSYIVRRLLFVNNPMHS